MFNKMVKMRNQKGFTLMELLIVVAIIAILVAISIPIFTSQLEKAREQTDIANLSAAKSVAVAAYLAGYTNGTGTDAVTIKAGDDFTGLYYDAVNGTLVKSAPAAYGKGTATKGGCETFTCGTGTYTEETVANGQTIQVSCAGGTVSAAFTTSKS